MTPTLMQNVSGVFENRRNFREHQYSIWGPTCDSIDCVVKDVALDSEILVSDWLKYKNMGCKSTELSKATS